MSESNIFETISTVIEDPSMNVLIKEAFNPMVNNKHLISSFTSLSEHSPIFQKSLSKLNETLESENSERLIKDYEDFYSNVMILSDELSLVIKEGFNRIKDKDISLENEKEIKYISSKAFIGASMLLLMTSNEDTFTKFAGNFKNLILNTDSSEGSALTQ